jgi:cytochrome c oxidase accessory protein FixG
MVKSPTPAAAASTAADADHSVTVVSLYQKENKIYARSVSGTFHRWRWVLVWLTQIVFYGLPWLQWNGRQAVLFELNLRRFFIGPLVLYPQDLIYLTALLAISAYGLFLFTAVAGRLWCGYACPQTVYTEIFMWIERRIEGDRVRRMKLDAASWSLDKLWRKVAKQAAWVALALWTGFTFVGYFTPIRTLGGAVMALGLGPWELFWVLFYSFATYGNAGFMREQVCKYMCPYARFQSAMFDRDTLIIGYDPARGEPRGARGRKVDFKARGLGECVDCTLCVQVCPTGIDIRKGLQYECIGCAACVDVCDGVMDKMGYPRGLIRYDTENGLQQQLSRRQVWSRVLRPRVLIYTSILVLIASAFLWSLAARAPFRVDVVRDRAALARIVEDGRIENIYRLQVMNNAEQPERYAFSVEGLHGAAISGVSELAVGPAEAHWVTLRVQIPNDSARHAGPGVHRIRFRIERLPAQPGDEAIRLHEKSTFVVPR